VRCERLSELSDANFKEKRERERASKQGEDKVLIYFLAGGA
jgi:hypothetical protein